jgi:putative DNA primase/helicase
MKDQNFSTDTNLSPTYKNPKIAALAAGNNVHDLLNLAAAAPEWSPPAKQSKTSHNGPHTEEKEKAQKPKAKENETSSLTPVREVLPDAPVPEGILVPEGYRLTLEGLFIESVKNGSTELTLLAPAPIIIAGRLCSISDDTENVRLAFWRDHEWRQVKVERAFIAGRSIADLANLGLPVNTVNATNLIKYLAAFEALNLDCLPRTQVSQILGWQGEEGSLGFLWGRALLSTDSQSGESSNSVAFRGADMGDEQMADAFASRGSLDEWVEAVSQVVEFPKVLIAVYAALTPPLLSILGCSNFIVDWCNPTSTGKTTVLRLGGYCWGVPDERAPASVLQT